MNKKIAFFSVVCLACQISYAAWYWPFGSDEKKPPRVSELMEPASILIDEASDLAESGKISDAVEKYKQALVELDRIEYENPERAQTAAFSTVRNKRAYVNAAIDSLHLKEAKQNARAVAVTDTSALEEKFAKAKEKSESSVAKKETKKADIAKKDDIAKKSEASPSRTRDTEKTRDDAKTRDAEKNRENLKQATDRVSRLKLAVADVNAKDYAAAKLTIDALLAETPNDVSALNLRARMEADQGDLRQAERTLDQAIQSHPRNYYAYYNMARVLIRARGAEGKASAKRYYDTGREFGGPKNAALEDLLK